MRRTGLGLLAIQTILLLAFCLALGGGCFPLGVRGEWEWPRLKNVSPSALDLSLAVVGALAYAAFAGLGQRSLAQKANRGWRYRAAWLAALVPAGVLAQLALLSGAPLGYGLTKWVTLGMPGSSGYFTVAKTTMGHPARFWADYPQWIKNQDSLHIGTHPPGLFLASRAVLDVMRASSALSGGITEHLPSSVADGFREILAPLPRADRAALATLGALTLLASVATCVPLYLLGRFSGLSSQAAWCAAACWPLVPATILFHPTADTAFALLSTTALALIARQRPASAAAAGAVLGIGMQFSLVFLAVGAVAAVTVLAARALPPLHRFSLIVWIGVGFLGLTVVIWAISSANPFLIWSINQRNHARFYAEYPRSYLAWVLANPVELTIAVGLPTVVWIAAGMRKAPTAAWATLAVLVLLTISGKNLSEVARLWLPLMPSLLLASGSGSQATGGKAWPLAATVMLLAAQTLVLECTLQVVYPVWKSATAARSSRAHPAPYRSG